MAAAKANEIPTNYGSHEFEGYIFDHTEPNQHPEFEQAPAGAE